MRLHLGCGCVHLPGFISVDKTAHSHGITDRVCDCEWLPWVANGNVEQVVSHAFFEHLLNPQAHLQELRRVLAPNGSIVYCGIPDAEAVWEMYQSGGFPIEEVERQLFGEYQATDPWAGAHKHLWTARRLQRELAPVFPNFAIFSYRYRDEVARVCLGFLVNASLSDAQLIFPQISEPYIEQLGTAA